MSDTKCTHAAVMPPVPDNPAEHAWYCPDCGTAFRIDPRPDAKPQPKPRVPARIIALIEQAIAANTMEKAKFHAGYVPGPNDDEYTDEIRKATKLYRETWVAGPLESALAYLKGEATLAETERAW